MIGCPLTALISAEKESKRREGKKSENDLPVNLLKDWARIAT